MPARYPPCHRRARGPAGRKGADQTVARRRTVLTAAGLAASGVAVAQGGPGLTALGPVRRRLAGRLAGYGDPGHVALTFDDGPDPRSTPAFLDLLQPAGRARDVLPAGLDGRGRAGTGRRGGRGRARDRRARLGAPVPDGARPAGDLHGHGARPGHDRCPHRAGAGPLPAALRRAQRQRAARGPAGWGCARCCGPAGAANGHPARHRRRCAAPCAGTWTAAPPSCCTTRTRRHRPVPPARRWARCRGCSTNAPGAAW